MEIQMWREKLAPYALAVDELKVKFEHMQNAYKNAGVYSPIEQIHGRVKTISSLLEKVQRKHISLDDIDKRIDDIAGIRIICQFVEDIYKVAELIRRRSDMEVIEEQDYIKNTKPSGYRSYHMVIKYVVETLNGPKEIHAEIQIRTLAMNFWATIEHSLQYKYKQNMPANLRSRLLKAADAIEILDSEMSSVSGEIMDAQTIFTVRSNLVADILNNIQNLYKLANKREIIKIQDEFFRIYESEELERLEKFAKELDVISEGYRAQSLR
ncbi:MAG: GTP pyrophosphokinase family protein [Lachnospiraceae bacterium]|nr:GTP pyrophosphokinase family protein [Lachnospiraceae bacterium]